MAGDGDVSVGATGERIPFLFTASADEMASLVNNRARFRFDKVSGEYQIVWVDEEGKFMTIPALENPTFDVNDEYLYDLKGLVKEMVDTKASIDRS